MSEFEAWLTTYELDELHDVLLDAGIQSVSDVALLNKDDLKELGVAIGPRNRLLAALAGSGFTAAPATPAAGLPAPPPAPAGLPNAPPPFTWRRSSGQILAEATTPLPEAPPPPLKKVASVAITTPSAMPQAPPPPMLGSAIKYGSSRFLPPSSTASRDTNAGESPSAPAAPVATSKPPLVWRRSVEGVWEEGERSSKDSGTLHEAHGGWEAFTTDDGEDTYYYHAATGRTVWDKPAEWSDDDASGNGVASGAKGWVAHVTDNGERYFHNEVTGETTWDAPQAWQSEAAAAADAASGLAGDPASPTPAMIKQRSTPGAVAAAIAAARPAAPLQPPPASLLPPPPTAPGAQARADDLVSIGQLVPPSPPPMPPPPMAQPAPDASAVAAAPPPFVWRRSQGEFLTDKARAQQTGMAELPPPPVPPAGSDAHAPRVPPSAAASGATLERLTATVARNEYGLGLSFNDLNELVYIDPRGGAAAEGTLRVGDVVLAIDGTALNGKPIREVASGVQAHSSTLLVVRPPAVAAKASTSNVGAQTATAQNGGDERASVVVLDSGAKSSDGKAAWQELALIVCRHCGMGSLGVALNDDNVVLTVKPGGVSDGILMVGDRILSVDGRELKGRLLSKVMKVQPTHCFKVLRMTNGASPDPAQSPEIRHKHHHSKWSGPKKWFGGKKRDNSIQISDASVSDWFGAMAVSNSATDAL